MAHKWDKAAFSGLSVRLANWRTLFFGTSPIRGSLTPLLVEPQSILRRGR
jgi:hypothetical protein